MAARHWLFQEKEATIDKDGKITFTPEPDFVGTAKGVL